MRLYASDTVYSCSCPIASITKKSLIKFIYHQLWQSNSKSLETLRRPSRTNQCHALMSLKESLIPFPYLLRLLGRGDRSYKLPEVSTKFWGAVIWQLSHSDAATVLAIGSSANRGGKVKSTSLCSMTAACQVPHPPGGKWTTA